MNSLVCLVDGEKDYTPISDEQEKKISKLINDKALPPSFTLNGNQIVSDTIIGFTDNPLPSKPSDNYEAFRASVTSSEWYKRSKTLARA